ncbi:MAG: hypothetical protein JST26_14550 [Bacteroidetes bacterium]|nr:hypothetical protein [Bacteroidota bacterium]
MKWHLENKLTLLILVLVFLIYGNTIRHEYALDDNYVTVTSPDAIRQSRVSKGIQGIPRILKTHYVEMDQQRFDYRPLVLVSFALEYEFFGSNPHISHFINVLLYALTCMLLFRLLYRLFATYHILFPFLATLLFVVHPIHSEVVASIKNRDEILSFLFGVSSLGCVLRSLEKKTWLYMTLAALFLFLALLSKATGGLFLIVLPLILYFFTSLKWKRILFIFLFMCMALLCQRLMKFGLVNADSTMREFAFFENPLFYEKGVGIRLLFVLGTLTYYLRLMIFPYPLSCYYGYNTVPGTHEITPGVILAVIIFLLIVFYAFRQFLQKTPLSFGLILFLIGLAAFSNMVRLMPGIVADRFVYFASWGECIAGAFLILKLFKIDPKTQKPGFRNISTSFWLGCISLILVFSGITMSRNSDWKDELTLFRNDIKHFDASCNLHYILANHLYNDITRTTDNAAKGRLLEEARGHYKKAAQLMAEGVKNYPADHTTLNNLGTIYVDVLNDPAAAAPFFKQALKTDADNKITQYNYAYCFERLNFPDSAMLYYEQYVKNGTDYLPVYIRLRELYIAKKLYSKAVVSDLKALGKSPSDPGLHINLGNSYMLCNDTVNGISEFEKAVQLNTENTALRNQVISFLKSIGRNSEARKLDTQ